MSIAISGSKSFIGKNLIQELENKNITDYITCDSFDELNKCPMDVDFIFHLLTEYRPKEPSAYFDINIKFTKLLLDKFRGKAFLLLSSTQSGNGTPYGESKKEAELLVLNWARNNNKLAYIFRVPNEFGKWCPPRLNSVVATFCDVLANKQELKINNPETILNLAYIDDIIYSFIEAYQEKCSCGLSYISPIYKITVGELANTLRLLDQKRTTVDIPEMNNGLIKKLYSTYLSYLPKQDFCYSLIKHEDSRGTFSELFHFYGNGQVSINISKAGITKGNHWHNTKTEKFVVVQGIAKIKFRKVGTTEIVEYLVSGDDIKVVDIPPGYTHSITNIGQIDLITVIWANEIYDSDLPDTYYLEV